MAKPSLGCEKIPVEIRENADDAALNARREKQAKRISLRLRTRARDLGVEGRLTGAKRGKDATPCHLENEEAEKNGWIRRYEKEMKMMGEN